MRLIFLLLLFMCCSWIDERSLVHKDKQVISGSDISSTAEVFNPENHSDFLFIGGKKGNLSLLLSVAHPLLISRATRPQRTIAALITLCVDKNETRLT